MPKVSNKQKVGFLVFGILGLFYLGYLFAFKESNHEEVSASSLAVTLPRVSFKNFEGVQTLAADPQGRPFLLHFWASDCAPCLDELPILLKMQKLLDKKLGLVTVSTDAELKNAKSYLAKSHFFDAQIESGILWLWDPRALQSSSTFAVVQVPETFLVTSDLRIVYKFTGAVAWSDQKNVELLNKYLF
jgi:thiol-disulfide isomerase/thioredoxin